MRCIWFNILFFTIGAWNQSFGQIAQGKPIEDELAQLLSSAGTFNSAINWIRESEESRVPILLQLTKRKDDVFYKCSPLSFGLVKALGILRVKQAIPYLMENVNCNIIKGDRPWMKTDEIIEQRMPALAAMISIGSDATEGLIELYNHPLYLDDQVIAIFGLSRIHDPKTLGFLYRVIGTSQRIDIYAMEGIKAINQPN